MATSDRTIKLIKVTGLLSGLFVFLVAVADLKEHWSLKPFGFAEHHQPVDCWGNLIVLDGAKEQFRIEHHKTNGEPVTLADLAEYLPTNRPMTCFLGGSYDLREIGLTPLCSCGTNPVTWYRRGHGLAYTFTHESGNMHRIIR
jgi:hypothetical protein